MRYFIDTEYNLDADNATITPISIGIVSETGLCYYAVTTMFARKFCTPFVQDHVLDNLFRFGDVDPAFQPMPCAISRGDISRSIRSFIGDDTPDFWGDCADFDYVVLSILMDGFEHWPENWPMYINDFQQEAIPVIESSSPHNALADAWALRESWNWAVQERETK